MATSAQGKIREEIVTFLRARLAEEHVRLPALVDQAMGRFRSDSDFLGRFADAMLYDVIHEAAVEEMASRIGPIDLRTAKVKVKTADLAPSIFGRLGGGTR